MTSNLPVKLPCSQERGKWSRMPCVKVAVSSCQGVKANLHRAALVASRPVAPRAAFDRREGPARREHYSCRTSRAPPSWSASTETKMIPPVTAFCQNVCTPSRFMPLTISARITEPTAVPPMPPTPPNSDVPPRQTAAMAGSRRSSPRPESAALMRAIRLSVRNTAYPAGRQRSARSLRAAPAVLAPSPALGAVMAALAERLKWPAPEFVDVTMMRLDVIADSRGLDDASLSAVLAQRMLLQLMSTNSLPARRRVQLGPGTWLATHTHDQPRILRSKALGFGIGGSRSGRRGRR